MRAAALLFAFAAPLFAAPVPKALKAKPLEERVLGKWRLVASNGTPNRTSNFRIVYKKDGELEFHREWGGGRAPVVYKGTYKLGQPDDTNRFGTIDWKIDQGGVERGELSRITELSDDVLEFKDPGGVVERFERVQDEEKKEK